MVDLTKKKTLSEYDTEALIDGDTVVTYRSTNAVGDKVFRGDIIEGTAASISDGTSTDLKMYSDKALKDALNTGAIPIGTAAEIETGTDTTAKLYAPDQLNSAIDSLIETAVPDGTEAQIIAGTDTAERKFTPADINGAVKDIAVAQYTGRTAMKAATGLTAGDVVYLSEGGRSGPFEYLAGDYSAEVAADPLEGVYVALDSDSDGSEGVLKRVLNGYVTPEMFGFTPNSMMDAAQNTNAFNSSITNCPRGFDHVHSSDGYVSGSVVIDRGYINIKWAAKLLAADGFSDDYLVTNTFEDDEDYFRWPLWIHGMLLDCRGVTRGLYSLSMDHVSWDNIRVENPYGNGIYIDRMRESKISFPNIINGLHRERFATPTDWSNATSYIVGDYVRVVDPDWDVATGYSPDDIVRYSGNRYICKSSSTGDQPDTNPLVWQQVPHEDYECVATNTNKNPQQYNTNATLVGDRYWQKRYQDEACIEISDVVTYGDRSNQIALISPIVRDCGNKCYVRVDSSKLPARPVTHFDIVFGHLHGQPIAQSGGAIPIPDMQRILELGYVINTNIIGTNIRCGDGDRCIAVMIGDGGSTKVTQDTRFKASVASGDGENDIGVLVMPSVQPSNSSELDVSFLVTDANSSDIHDPRRTFRRNVKTEQRCILPAGINGAPGGYTVVGPSGEYSIVRPYAYSESGDSQPRLDVSITNSSSEIRFGPGGSTSPDAILRRNATGRLSTNAEFRLETGDWTQPLIFGTYRVWVDASGLMRINGAAPSSDSDGTVVGTQA